MRRLLMTAAATLAIAASAFSSHSYAQTEGAAPASLAVVDALAARDLELFTAFFDRCDPVAVRAMVTDDFEFFHDKGGLTNTTGDSFAADLKAHCERVVTGEDFAARRELIPESVKVYVLNNYGAMTVGEHRFFKLTPGKPDEQTETGRFIIVWKLDAGVWKMARVVSYDHHLAH